jgi:hypothetical protein
MWAFYFGGYMNIDIRKCGGYNTSWAEVTIKDEGTTLQVDLNPNEWSPIARSFITEFYYLIGEEEFCKIIKDEGLIDPIIDNYENEITELREQLDVEGL